MARTSTREHSVVTRMPAEWERHAATWIAWPHKAGDWPTKFGAIPWVFAEMVRLLHGAERVRVLATGGVQRAAERILAVSGVDLSQVDFVRAKTDRSWVRDYLPTFALDESGSRCRALVAVKWRFNGWARYPDHKQDEAAGQLVAQHFATRTVLPTISSRGKLKRLVAEGGGLEVDGQGTLITSDHCLLSGRYARNLGTSREQLEAAFAAALGVRKVIWVGDGICGDDTSGHVDDFVRFVRPGVVVLCRASGRDDPNRVNLSTAARVLREATDANGRRLEIIELPLPEAVTYRGERLPASYANFYIGNEVVIVPTFNDANDAIALGILAEAFPTRRVVGVYARDLVLGLGTLHCSTQQEPSAEKPRAPRRA